ncbi:MAG: response regulator transcription factor [Aggregatilineales bacterium]
MQTVREQTQQILVVEDDIDTAEVVTALLETAGYQAVVVGSGQLALDEIQASPPDLVLLDINLPDMSGLEVLREVRANSLLPMIIISGRTGGSDKVKAFDLGADHYLAKPFANEELMARVAALLRRVERMPPQPKLVVRDLELDMDRRQAMLRGRRLHLTPIEYGILVTLMRAPDTIITHEALLRAVWGDQYEGDFSVLRVNISRLRQKLEDNPRDPTYIVTAAGQGYIMPIRQR